jgi:mannose-6-phosphate isomerase
MTDPLYPLKFQPLFKRYLWGGRRLATVLGKALGEGEDFAESWEIADHEQGQSIVANGPLAGTPLHELVLERPADLFGKHEARIRQSQPAGREPRFPLIFKYLDAQRDLSVQVHPHDAAAAQLTPPDLGKTEAWLVLGAQPGSRIYAGLKFGFGRAELAREVERGRTELCLNWFEARSGQCLFIPAGTVHALGAGLLVAEIQQASDTTYRLFDWNRVGPDGQPRKLHVTEALAAIDYTQHVVKPQTPQPTERPSVERSSVERLIVCDKFILDRWRLSGMEKLGGDQRFHILSVLEGEVLLSGSSPQVEAGRRIGASTSDEVSLLSLIRGQTVLLPASLGQITVASRDAAVMLDMYLP